MPGRTACSQAYTTNLTHFLPWVEVWVGTQRFDGVVKLVLNDLLRDMGEERVSYVVKKSRQS